MFGVDVRTPSRTLRRAASAFCRSRCAGRRARHDLTS